LKRNWKSERGIERKLRRIQWRRNKEKKKKKKEKKVEKSK
jgi:hypothetical protein